MTRINTNVSSLIAQRVLTQNNNSLNTSLQRLSTGLKINSGADDPAGLIASENLRSEQTGIQQAIDNGGRASNIIGTADGGLNEVSSLLTQLQSLVGQSANSGGLSAEEQQANQLQADSILSTINRIAGSTAFQGTKLLNGNYAYTTSGVAASAVGSFQVNSALLPNNVAQSVTVTVTNSATEGQLKFTGTAQAIGGSAVTLEIAGTTGTQQLTFAASSKLSAIATAINNISSVTGVTASASGSGVTFKASDYGSDQYVSVRSVAGAAFNVTGGTSGKAFGTDAKVLVNGAQAEVKGLNVTYRDANLDIDLQLTSKGFNGTTAAGLNNGKSKTFSITGGGASFALGSKVTESNKANIGIQSVSTGSLGDGVLGYLSSLGSGGSNSLTSKNLDNAQKILDASVKQVSQLRGRLGAFQKYTIDSTVNALNVAYENASSAQSAISDTDFASETASLTRSQILSQAANTVLVQANAAPQSALTLLRG